MPERTQPPVATPDTISARAGDVVDIPVLANDEHPDALPLTLAPGSIQEPEHGLLFVAGDRLRYFAPDTAGEYEAIYRVDGPDGQYADGERAHLGARGGPRDEQPAGARDRHRTRARGRDGANPHPARRHRPRRRLRAADRPGVEPRTGQT